MVLIAAVILASAPHLPRQTSAPAVQATATVRILSGVRLHLGEGHRRDGLVVRDSMVRAGGANRPAKLIEFE